MPCVCFFSAYIFVNPDMTVIDTVSFDCYIKGSQQKKPCRPWK